MVLAYAPQSIKRGATSIFAGKRTLPMIEIAEAVIDSLQRLFAEPVCSYQVQRILLGNPPVIDRFPAITVELDGNENTPLTLGTFSQTHRLTITAWASTTSYEESYRLRAKLATMIESSLFRSVFPVVAPYCYAYLAEPLPAGQTWATVDDPSAFSYPYEEQPLPIYLDNGSVRYPNSFLQQMGDSVFQLERPSPIDFDTEAIVIRPRVHVYDALVESVDYGTGNQGELLLLHATMNYSLKIARLRYQEPYQAV